MKYIIPKDTVIWLVPRNSIHNEMFKVQKRMYMDKDDFVSEGKSSALGKRNGEPFYTFKLPENERGVSEFYVYKRDIKILK